MPEWSKVNAFQVAIDKLFMSKVGVTAGVDFKWKIFKYTFSSFLNIENVGEDIMKFVLSHKDAFFTTAIMISIINKFIEILTRGDVSSDGKGLKNMISTIGTLQKSSVHYLANFVSSCTVPVISISILAILLTDERFGLAIFSKSNIFLIWLLLTLYVISIVIFAIFLNTLFKNKTFGIFIFFLTFVSYSLIEGNYINFMFLICMLGNSGLTQGIRNVLFYEKVRGNGVQFDNFFSFDNYDKISLAMICFSLLVSSMMV